MSRTYLDMIQNQLKVAIQNHQMLLSEFKSDPKNLSLQKQLHDFQTEIRNLSEKQKSAVQQFRRDIMIIQADDMTEENESEMNQSIPTDLSQKTAASIDLSQRTTVSPDLSQCAALSTAADLRVNNLAKIPSPGPSVESQDLTLRVPDLTIHKPTNETESKDPTLNLKTSNQPRQQSTVFKKPLDANIGSSQNGKTAQLEKKEVTAEDKQKLEFMASLNLVTPSSLKELQSRRSERKRKSTTNPQFCYGHFEPENLFNAPKNESKSKPRDASAAPPMNDTESSDCSSPIQPSSEVREDCCTVCHRSGELLMCDVCSLVYHLQCLDPPLTSVPTGLWSCPKCQSLSKQYGGKEDWPGTLALVHSYLMHKAAKEEERKKMQKVSDELTKEKRQLEEKARQLKESLVVRHHQKSELVQTVNTTQKSLENLKNFVRLFQKS